VGQLLHTGSHFSTFAKNAGSDNPQLLQWLAANMEKKISMLPRRCGGLSKKVLPSRRGLCGW